ncbi:MAG: response regulator [Nitrospiraceae bacterium]
MCLPRCDQSPPVHIVARLSETVGGHKTILLVEDDEDVRIVVGDMLRANGYQVQEAADGAQALQILHATPNQPHLVLTDVMMPRMTGPVGEAVTAALPHRQNPVHVRLHG